MTAPESKALDDFLAQFDLDGQERILRYALDHVVPRMKRLTPALTTTLEAPAGVSEAAGVFDNICPHGVPYTYAQGTGCGKGCTPPAQPKAQAQAGGASAQPKLIGWRTDDYLMETSDHKTAKSWEVHYNVLPIFEGDTNTKLAAPEAPQPKAPPSVDDVYAHTVAQMAEEQGMTVEQVYRAAVRLYQAERAGRVTVVHERSMLKAPPSVGANHLPVHAAVIADLKQVGKQCADSGTCHHACEKECFREQCCVPLSIAASYLNDDWTLRTPTAPAVEPQAVPAALTDLEIDTIDDKTVLHWMAPQGRETVRQFARAIERAHGIASTQPEGAAK